MECHRITEILRKRRLKQTGVVKNVRRTKVSQEVIHMTKTSTNMNTKREVITSIRLNYFKCGIFWNLFFLLALLLYAPNSLHWGNLAAFSASLYQARICAGHRPDNAALVLLPNSHGFGKNQLAAANPTGKTWESLCQHDRVWESCRFGRQMVALLHNCAKYSSCDKTLQFMTGYLGQGLHFPESYLGAWCILWQKWEFGQTLKELRMWTTRLPHGGCTAVTGSIRRA